MRPMMIAAMALLTVPVGCATTGSSGDLGRVLGEVIGQQTGQGGALSQAEIDAGLREPTSWQRNWARPMAISEIRKFVFRFRKPIGISNPACRASGRAVHWMTWNCV